MGLTKDEAAKILDCNVDDDAGSIKKKYHKLALKLHPDKNKEDPDATAKFQRIAEAHKCLTDPNYVADETGMTEEELKKEMEAMYNVMYAQFKMMCKMSGIPAPPPALMRAMMAGSVNEAMVGDDVDPNVKEQFQNVMDGMGGADTGGLDAMMSSAFAELDSDDEVDEEGMFAAMMGGGGGGGSEEDLMAAMLSGGGGMEEMMAAMMGDGLGDDSDDGGDGEGADQMAGMMAAMMGGGGGGGDMAAMMAAMGGEDVDDEALAAMMGLGSAARPPSKSKKTRRGGKKKKRPVARAKAPEEVETRPPRLGDRVECDWGEGTVRFLGSVHYAKGDDWVGVELDAADGKNDGTIKGTQYFVCQPKHGCMVRVSDVDLL